MRHGKPQITDLTHTLPIRGAIILGRVHQAMQAAGMERNGKSDLHHNLQQLYGLRAIHCIIIADHLKATDAIILHIFDLFANILLKGMHPRKG